VFPTVSDDVVFKVIVPNVGTPVMCGMANLWKPTNPVKRLVENGFVFVSLIDSPYLECVLEDVFDVRACANGNEEANT
jgi:hypothetical protein